MTNPYAKIATSVLRFAAFGLVVGGFCLLATDYYLYLKHRPFSGPIILALKGAPVLAGFILFLTSRRIAERLTKDLD